MYRHASPTMLRSAPATASLIVFTTLSSFSKTLRILFMVLPFAFGRAPMTSAQRRFATFASAPNLTTSTHPARPTGFHTA